LEIFEILCSERKKTGSNICVSRKALATSFTAALNFLRFPPFVDECLQKRPSPLTTNGFILELELLRTMMEFGKQHCLEKVGEVCHQHVQFPTKKIIIEGA